jgi:hypothetical protein
LLKENRSLQSYPHYLQIISFGGRIFIAFLEVFGGKIFIDIFGGGIFIDIFIIRL